MRKEFLISFLILFLAYSLFVRLIPNRQFSQTLWQENTIRAERYLYDPKINCEDVIVGSSMSFRLIMDSLPGFCNLSFSGLTIFDGLDVVKRKRDFPQRVFVEMNVLFKEKSEDLHNSVIASIPYHLKKWEPSLRNDKQPLTILGSGIISMRIRIFGPTQQPVGGRSAALKDDDPLFQRMLSFHHSYYDLKPALEEEERKMNELKKAIEELKRNGVEIIFYELPIHPSLMQQEMPKAIRKAFARYFPPEEYTYIPLPPDTSAYHTTDGMHFTVNEAHRYSGYMRRSIDAINAP